MTAQVAGLVMGAFAALFSAFLYWGGFEEQRRAKRDLASRK